MSSVGRTVGLFGGTFDPVHQGHLDLACHVLERCGLDNLLFIPAPRPPHKGRPSASFAHRVAMLEAALVDCPDGGRMRCSAIEAELPEPSYTIHTVEALIRRQPDCRYALVIGADSLFDLPHWYRAAELLALIDLIVVRRDRIEPTAIGTTLATLDSSFQGDEHHHRWRNSTGRTVTYLDDIELPVSSSSIREDLALGREPAMLPSAVLAYIKTHHLYGWRNSA
ncbi:nicotinate (nicotinamide) nucleotide adenylyltransferase [Desulfobulbus propionicus DSM 2032]|uniref:Probable nicotinate-nucleotide adenylyltransferase n=1 Tax=Desulfobulbus propionicus (strain ATCC 33891 / DSM 2032 / VKM B-1956 / 1pr3) TaxID=577650 RepID=A0A7U4DNQ7_DESPD|nr:nicotinate (nicotinamide) nucleotide adenylyltransferase [Desulfobulbus propionicus]ADW17259.1 nicotinate (nicotinamide) nucleotide adenylyltransferase [Desulfobulbus propionicus DSM 2032]